MLQWIKRIRLNLTRFLGSPSDLASSKKIVFISRDHTWDVNEYLVGLREDVKSWKEVYWRWENFSILQISVA